MSSEDPLREFALIGAKVRLAELELKVQETKNLIRLLSNRKSNKKAVRLRRSHSPEFKLKVVSEARKTSASEVAKKYDLSRSLVDKWASKVK